MGRIIPVGGARPVALEAPATRQNVQYSRGLSAMQQEVQQHGGNVQRYAEACDCTAGEILDFSANINPLGFPEWTRPLLSRQLDQIARYPDPDSRAFSAAIASHFKIPLDRIMVGNGSSEILAQIPSAASAARAVIPAPAYSDYARSAVRAGLAVYNVVLAEKHNFAMDWEALERTLTEADIVYLGQPNNPTGQMFDTNTFKELARRHPATHFVVDESFADFVDGYDSIIALVDHLPNVVVLRSMTKFFAVPGLRLGFAVAAPHIASRIREQLVPWSVNTLAQAFGARAFQDEAYARETRKCVAAWRTELFRTLSELPGIKLYPSQANFILGRFTGGEKNAGSIAAQLLQRHHIAIRVCDNFAGLDDKASFFRIAVGTPEQNQRLCAALADLRNARNSRKQARHRRRTPAIMFQGTSSNAGKSVLTAGLCRVLLQDGIRVAPFKAQNMSLNSYVTLDGGEMGRAQVVQAQACRLDPDVRMNPILLKPSSDTGAQVILRGQPAGNMNVLDYEAYKKDALQTVQECYDSLSTEFDAIVLEGAGSPGEVNLKKNDIVNMRMARYAQAPVLLVGDIDRGGVYAAFVGTMEVLAEWERELVAGFVVNRFRGDATLLKDAHDYMLEHTNREVFGIIPYMHDLGLPEEDSVEFKSGRRQYPAKGDDTVDIAVVDLPHISNFTDFDPLNLEPDVTVRIVRKPDALGQPDAVIIPGSKNTIADLRALRDSRFEAAILALANHGHSEIIGICGGFQMLGRSICDPLHLESETLECPGLNLLELSTTMAARKTLRRGQMTHAESGATIVGYEIHHGQTACGPDVQAWRSPEGDAWGATSADGRVWGTYLHGVFDADQFRRWFINRLRQRRGLAHVDRILAVYDIEPALERLAGLLREHLDIHRIHRLMGL